MAPSEKKPQYDEKRKESMMKYAKENLKRIPLDVQKAEYDKIKAVVLRPWKIQS